MNLSIFNFEQVLAIWQSPRRIKGWALFLLAGMFGCVFLCSSFLAVVFNDAPLKALKLPSPDTEVLLLGNSQYRGIVSAPFSRPFHNAALPGSDYVIQEAIFNAHLRHAPNLKVVLLGFDNIPLRVTGISNRKGDFSDILDCGVPWHEIPDVPLAERLEFGISYYPWLKPLLIGPKLDMDAVESLLFDPVDAATLPPLTPPDNFDPSKAIPPFTASPGSGAKKMGYYTKHLARQNNLDKNHAALLRIVETCRDRGLQLILLRGPTTKEFRETRSAAWDQELDQLYQDIAEAYGGNNPPLWNDDQNEDFPIYLFDDPNHLNAQGFLRYSQLLNMHLEKMSAQ